MSLFCKGFSRLPRGRRAVTAARFASAPLHCRVGRRRLSGHQLSALAGDLAVHSADSRARNFYTMQRKPRLRALRHTLTLRATSTCAKFNNLARCLMATA